LPDRNDIFFVATKKTKQKKTRTLSWACCTRRVAGGNPEPFRDGKVNASPFSPEALEVLCGAQPAGVASGSKKQTMQQTDDLLHRLKKPDFEPMLSVVSNR
jgi:hypothetical protein